MKFLLILPFLLFGQSFAFEIKILEKTTFFNESVSTVEFEVNKDLGRAWVNISIDEFYGEPDSNNTQVFRQKIDGLSFDHQTASIVLDRDGQLHECAQLTTKGRSIFRHTFIKNTGCEFHSKLVTVDYDNGFEIKRINKIQVFLIVK
jgi:hypothetical protein